MDYISVFDMFKIGVGPSSSHTLGPWIAARQFIELLQPHLEQVQAVHVDLYGSLSLTGKGHATDLAVMLGLEYTDPKTIPVYEIDQRIQLIQKRHQLRFAGCYDIPFNPQEHIQFHNEFLPFHANGLRLKACLQDGSEISETYYSTGGGFVVTEHTSATVEDETLTVPYPVYTAADLLQHCHQHGLTISEVVWQNELALKDAHTVSTELDQIWATMRECAFLGCHTEGVLPGGLQVRRRAYDMYMRLTNQEHHVTNPYEWITAIKQTNISFRQILKWVSCFALAVNEVNAAMGRVVTAPTNGSAGVIPAVLLYYVCIENHHAKPQDIHRALMVAGVVGSLFKRSATISAAMGGCQAEIGVSSGMAAAALCELLGGTPEQVLMAAEVAVEHHLGLTCDPVGGLVQVPCIERNSMGAIKAINAAELAIETDPKNAKVPLDKVVATLWQTAQDMNTKYKETSEAGLAVAVNIADC